MINLVMGLCWQVYTSAWFSWNGREFQDICENITKINAQFWLQHEQECMVLVWKNFLSYYVPARNFFVAWYILWTVHMLTTHAIKKMFASRHVETPHKLIDSSYDR